MESVGQTLREERLRQLLTLQEVSANTRISLKNLEAIERDDLEEISSPFFYRSFVRQYAERLGIDFSDLSVAVNSSASTMPRPLMPGENGAPLPRVGALRPPRKFDLRWISSIASLVVVFAGCSAVYALWHASMSPSGRASIQQFLSRFQTVPPHSSPPRQQSVHRSPPSSEPSLAERAQNEAPQAATAAGFSIEVSALERTWLSIVSDGTRIYSGILQADQSKTLEGHDSVLIKTGNAGGVDVVFNGKEIGTLGRKGQIRTVVFTRDNYQIVDRSEHALLQGFPLAIRLASYRRATHCVEAWQSLASVDKAPLDCPASRFMRTAE
ncbi:MAG: RodZ domain-containing protein [Bryobacteraceae bacterium]